MSSVLVRLLPHLHSLTYLVLQMGLNLFLFGITWNLKSVFSLDGDYEPVKNALDDRDSIPNLISYGEDEGGGYAKKMSMCSVSSVDMDREKVRSISVA